MEIETRGLGLAQRVMENLFPRDMNQQASKYLRGAAVCTFGAGKVEDPVGTSPALSRVGLMASALELGGGRARRALE